MSLTKEEIVTAMIEEFSMQPQEIFEESRIVSVNDKDSKHHVPTSYGYRNSHGNQKYTSAPTYRSLPNLSSTSIDSDLTDENIICSKDAKAHQAIKLLHSNALLYDKQSSLETSTLETFQSSERESSVSHGYKEVSDPPRVYYRSEVKKRVTCVKPANAVALNTKKRNPFCSTVGRTSHVYNSPKRLSYNKHRSLETGTLRNFQGSEQECLASRGYKKTFSSPRAYYGSKLAKTSKRTKPTAAVLTTTKRKPFCTTVGRTSTLRNYKDFQQRRSSIPNNPSKQTRAISRLDSRKPFCSVVSSSDNNSRRDFLARPRVARSTRSAKSNRATRSKMAKTSSVPSVFDRMHGCSRDKQIEGKMRRNEVHKQQNINKLYRSGAMCKQTKISSQRALDVYYRGMMHLLKKEQILAHNAHIRNEPFVTRMNLPQMYDYFITLKGES